MFERGRESTGGQRAKGVFCAVFVMFTDFDGAKYDIGQLTGCT